QIKFVDASGDNVWWMNRSDFTPPHEWQQLKVRRRQIDFAWGPTEDKQLRRAAALEFVIASGQGGGQGTVCLDELRLQALPATDAPLPPPRLSASSAEAGHAAAMAMDGQPDSSWRSDARRPQTLIVDFGRVREFGGLVLHWRAGAQATRYDLQLSDDGRRWTTVRRVTDGQRSVQPLLLTESEARFLRLRLAHGAGPRYALAEIEVKDLAWGASRNSFLQALAREAPRGHYPRGWRGEQPYWTVVGVDGGGASSALFGEDGAIEVGKGGFSVEPFLVADGQLISWADATITQSLQDQHLPIPSVHWQHAQAVLDITAVAIGTREQSQLLMRYRVSNPSMQRRRLTLALAVRPLQVNPATQFLNDAGGAARVTALAVQGGALAVNGQPRLWPLQAPADVIGSSFDAGDVVERLAAPEGTAPLLRVNDDFGAASAALRYTLDLAPGESRDIAWLAPLAGRLDALPPLADNAWAERQQAAVAAAWHERLNRVSLTLPQAAQPLADTLRSAHAQMLISRDGPALQPGTRAYARTWVRDGAMMAEGLLRLGETQAARDFVHWYAPYQFKSGKVPCCVDRRGADPVAENDSHGELIFSIAELYRYTRDEAELRRLWPHVDAAVRYMDGLRASERSEQNRHGAQAANYGLMPASISHEGYSAKAMHSYWDDFWALRGYKDAVVLAQALGDGTAAQRIAVARDEFRADLQASIVTAAARHRIDFIPGAAELGDFDATSTTIALTPGGEQAHLPPALLHATFERYWQGFVERRDGHKVWADYTPYELRNVGAFVRLGWRDRAQALLRFFMADRRPAAWNQWAEVVGREAREPRFIGDMPHAWISSDYIRSVLDLVAYERESDQSLVLAAGVPLSWLNEGVTLRGLATPHGRLSYRLRREGSSVLLDIEAGLRLPPGGLVLAWPGEGALPAATIDGAAATWQGRELRVPHVPARVLLPDG
ncbi:discoidin domain-containing protein, partial [Aquabacterium sp.]|uniref:discoidin domain-containing protein n=1 Tax=Aquabacterium sp. TaxID=1872578 RepID=UPI002D0C5035